MSPSVLGSSYDVFDGEQCPPFDSRFVVRALGTIRAILRTTAGFYRQQLAELHFTARKILTVHCLCDEYDIEDRPAIDGLDLLSCPIMFEPTRLHDSIINGPRLRQEFGRIRS